MNNLKRYEGLKCGKCKAEMVRLYRPYQSFRDKDNDRCLAHCESSYVPLVLDEDSNAWGYTSCPEKDMDIWRQMPEIIPAGIYYMAEYSMMQIVYDELLQKMSNSEMRMFAQKTSMEATLKKIRDERNAKV